MITPVGFTYRKFNFPVGEKHIVIEQYREDSRVGIFFEYESDADTFELLLVADAVKRLGLKLDWIDIQYVPYSRQDRVNQTGEPLSIKVFADIINLVGAKEVFITDPHSDVTSTLINNCKVKQQYEVFIQYFETAKNYLLISPDAGALKKVYKLAKEIKAQVVECSKNRDTATGEIIRITVHSQDLDGKDCYILDDICDGGRTFIEIAKELKKLNCGKVILMVTHGFFTKGLGVFDGLIDEVYTRNGRVK